MEKIVFWGYLHDGRVSVVLGWGKVCIIFLVEIIVEFNQKSVLKSENTKFGSNRFAV